MVCPGCAVLYFDVSKRKFLIFSCNDCFKFWVCILPYTIGAPVFLNQGVLKQNQRENAFQKIYLSFTLSRSNLSR
jgi:hypothetical protein